LKLKYFLKLGNEGNDFITEKRILLNLVLGNYFKAIKVFLESKSTSLLKEFQGNDVSTVKYFEVQPVHFF